ncbi:MAG: ammonium transporter [Alphaproteobacteria bacterium]|nr:ammonium transporter [Alphaproteobacteria bacterium]
MRTPLIVAALLASSAAFAEDGPTAADAMFTANNTWMMVSAFLVFLMHLGFATLESGMTQAKNTVNILFKNMSILSIGILTYAVVGFNLMYPGSEYAGAFFGFAGFGVGTDAAGLTAEYNPGYTYWTDFLFQAMFAATAATIVSGAVAERIKLATFLAFGTIYVAIAYPMVGMWQWGGGFLAELGFHDFAGSTIVHSVGGWAALAGAWLLGPRLNRFDKGIHPHSLPLAAIGALLLWFGWYGFNGGSVLSADPGATSLVVVNTTLGAAAGLMSCVLVTWALTKTPDLSMAINGSLAGLVGITAGADLLTPMTSVVVGGIAGVLVIGGIYALEKLRIDDPVGAVPVHLVCGAWGTLAVGLFSAEVSVGAQLAGIAATGAFCLPIALVLFFVLGKVMGLRVSEDEEILGLDLGEHGALAYTGLQHLTPKELEAAVAAK